jgi:hypothetical protein
MSAFLKVLSAMVVGGQIATTGEVVEVTESEARVLIRLGKAEPANEPEQVLEKEEAGMDAMPTEPANEPERKNKGKK